MHIPTMRMTGRILLILLAVSLPALAAEPSHNLGPANTVAGATGGQTLQDGLPIGSWYCVYTSDNVNSIFTIKSLLSITPDRVAHFQSIYDAAYKPNYHFGVGKFTGLQRISWTTVSIFKKIARIKNELYCYPDPESRAKLVAANPPGHALIDYETLGGALTKSQSKSYMGDDGGIDIYKIVGKDLVLENSTDGNRWLYKSVGLR